jgi:sulfoxide reductase heme-binding subunit YedZ
MGDVRALPAFWADRDDGPARSRPTLLSRGRDPTAAGGSAILCAATEGEAIDMRWLEDPRMPWTDRGGRFSAFRAAVLAALFIPPLVLLGRALGDGLGPRPLTEAIHDSGDWAARLLVLTIVLTPLRQVSGRSELVGIRRMVGLAAFLTTVLHAVLYGFDQDLDPGRIAFEILVRPHLVIGAVTLVGLAGLAATSTDGAIRRMGAAAWRRLHGLVHPIAILALVHVFLQSKLDLAQPAILTGIACGGLAVRIAAERGDGGGLLGGLAASATAAIAAAASEAVWFALRSGRSALPLLAGNLDASFRWPPSWVAAAVVAAAFAAARLLRRRRPTRG